MSDQIREIVEALDTVQDTMKEFDGKLNALEKEKIDKAADDMTKKIEAFQSEEAKKDAEYKARIETLEAEIAKGSRVEDEEYKVYDHEFKLYLRKSNSPPSREAIEKATDIFISSKSGLDDRDKEVLKKDLVSGSNPDGGYFILPDRATGMIKRLFETSPMRQICTVVSTSSDTWEMLIDDDEADCGWVGETETRADTGTPQVGLLQIPIHEVYAQPRATQKMLDDAAFDVESWLTAKATDKIARTENTSFVTGNGSKKPKGFTTYTAWTTAGTYQRDAIEVRSSGHAGGFGSTAATRGNCIIDLQSDLHEEYQANARFAGTRKTLGEISKLKDGQGVFLFDRAAFIASGMKEVVLGKPYTMLADMAEVDTDALALAYGDFREGYTIVDRIGIRVLRDPYTAKPYIKFYTTKRVGGAVTNYEAIKLLKLSA